MIALLGLLHHLLVLLELLGVLPCRGVDALEHLSILVTTPVGAGHTLKLDGLLGNLASALDVGSGAQVPPLLSNLVDGNWLGFDGVQNLQLERLTDLLDAPLGLLSRHLLPFDGIVLPDDLVHPLLDLLEVLIGQLARWDGFSGLRIGRFRKVKVVVEAIIDPRADGHLRLGEYLLDGHGHHVGRGVTQFEQFVVVLVGWEFLDDLGLYRLGSRSSGSPESNRLPRRVETRRRFSRSNTRCRQGMRRRRPSRKHREGSCRPMALHVRRHRRKEERHWRNLHDLLSICIQAGVCVSCVLRR